jgi:hypothetical protein
MTKLIIKTVAVIILVLLLAVCQKKAHGGPTPTPTPEPKPAAAPISLGTTTESPRTVRICHLDYGNWLTISFSGEHGDQWHPNWTSIVCVYKPIVRKLPQGRWEITFTDELSEGLP